MSYVRRRLALSGLMILATIAFLLGACGGNEETGAPTPTRPASTAPAPTASAPTTPGAQPTLQPQEATPAQAPVSRPGAAAAGQIAFVSNREGQSSIYVINPDGTGLARLTNSTADDALAAWSPDGKRIAFTSNRDGNFEIYVINADGPGQTRLTDNPAADGNPAWSPDGQRIAFNSNRDGNFEIYVMNADGSGPTPLTNDDADDGYPAWSSAKK